MLKNEDYKIIYLHEFIEMLNYTNKINKIERYLNKFIDNKN